MILTCACWKTTSRRPFWSRTSWQQVPTGRYQLTDEGKFIIVAQFSGIFSFLPSGFQPDGHPAVRAGPDSHLPTGRRHARDRPCQERGDSPPGPAQESHIGRFSPASSSSASALRSHPCSPARSTAFAQDDTWPPNSTFWCSSTLTWPPPPSPTFP